MANKFMNGFDKSSVSSEEAWELYLVSVNDGDLYRQRIEPILANLKKKIKKGTYDETLALKLWKYAADDGAQKYTEEYDTPRRGSSFGIFTVAMRKEVALLMQSHYEDELRYAKNPSGDSSVRSPTSTSSDVRSPTRTSTKAHTTGNFTATVTGGAGRGANTVVNLYPGARKTNPNQRVTEKQLNALVDRINKAAGTPLEPWIKVGGKLTAQLGNYHLDSAYGGHKLSQMVSAGGGTRDITYGYDSKRVLLEKLNGILTGSRLGLHKENPRSEKQVAGAKRAGVAVRNAQRRAGNLSGEEEHYESGRKEIPQVGSAGWTKKGRAYYRLKFIIEPPVEGRVMSPDKWLLLYRPSFGVTEAIGAFPSLRGAKDFADTRRLSIEEKYKRRAKNPSARLVHRRKINTKRGYFPNPLKDKIALHFNAGNNTNGNPRRVFVVVDTQGKVHGAYDEGYRGEASVTKHFPDIAIVGRFNISVAQYNELLKDYPFGGAIK